jgi:hypothetical protein
MRADTASSVKEDRCGSCSDIADCPNRMNMRIRTLRVLVADDDLNALLLGSKSHQVIQSSERPVLLVGQTHRREPAPVVPMSSVGRLHLGA